MTLARISSYPDYSTVLSAVAQLDSIDSNDTPTFEASFWIGIKASQSTDSQPDSSSDGSGLQDFEFVDSFEDTSFFKMHGVGAFPWRLFQPDSFNNAEDCVA